jgi:UDP-N-acetylmuramoyl-tripeptide--D-alanyl-D-alanine ligase
LIKRTLADVAAMSGGTLSGDADGGQLIQGVSKDTRTIEQGNLYVPLIGEAFDGHAFVQSAFEKGAAASFWQKDHEQPPTGVPLIIVEDTLAALQQLAKAYRHQLDVRVVGITGSNGKTTTKDMTAAVLSTRFQVHKTLGNYNNHIGLPLTMLQLSEETQIAVLEMGMSGRWEIDFLSRLAEPEIVVITNIGESHLLQLGSRTEIARAKTEILAGLQEDGVLVYNGDEPLIEEVLPELDEPGRRKGKSFRRVRFGAGTDNDLYPLEIRMEGKGTYFTVNTDKDTTVYIPLLGSHNVVNALAALAVGKHFGLRNDTMAEGLRSLVMTGMRIEVSVTPSRVTILNDAYNASPTSMRAAIDLLQELHAKGRKFAVLADMLELGEQEADFHREIGRHLNPAHVHTVYTYGPLGAYIAEGAREKFPQDRVRYFEEKEQLAHTLSAATADGDVVLIKGSRGMKMEQVAARLMQVGGV